MTPAKNSVIHRSYHDVDGHLVAADTHLLADGRPPVVSLHGIMVDLDLAPLLFVDPTKESWIALSLPGHAPGRFRPGTHRSEIDEQLFAQLVERPLAALLGSRKVIAAGWSTGGFAALNLAVWHPERVAGVASLAGFGRVRLSGSVGWLNWVARGPLGRHCLAWGLRLAARWPAFFWLFARRCTARDTAVDDATIARLFTSFRGHDPDTLVDLLAMLTKLDSEERLGGIHVPAWIAGGLEDPLIRSAETRRLAGLLPNSTLALYPGGHLFFCEWPGMQEDFARWMMSNGLRESIPGDGHNDD